MVIGIWKAIAFIVGLMVLFCLLIFIAAMVVAALEEIIEAITDVFKKK